MHRHLCFTGKAPGQGFEPRSWTSKAHVLPLDHPGKPVVVSVGGLEPPASTFAEWRSGSTELNAPSSGRGIRTPIVPGNSRTLYLLSYPPMRRVGWDLNPLSVKRNGFTGRPGYPYPAPTHERQLVDSQGLEPRTSSL